MVLLLCTAFAAGQTLSSIVVRVQEASGAPFELPVLVTLIPAAGGLGFNLPAALGGIAIFNAIGGGEYTIQVTAAGYRTAREPVQVLGFGGSTQVFVVLRPVGEAGDGKSNASALSPKASKELSLALVALQEGKPNDAAPHLAFLLKKFGKYPDVLYVAGVYDVALNHPDAAREHLEAAIKVRPTHFGAQLTLGALLVRQGTFADAVAHLDKATSIDRNSWRAHWLLADAMLRDAKDFPQAKFHAERAIELGKDKAFRAMITLAVVESRLGDRESSRATLEKFLQDYPKDQAAPEARRLLGGATVLVAANIPSVPSARALPEIPDPPILEMPSNLPKDIDEAIPPVAANTACPLEQVLDGAARRAVEFADGLGRFSATEHVVHQELDAQGRTRKSSDFSFKYDAVLQHPRPDTIVMSEFRNGSMDSRDFPAAFSANGIPALGLVFDSRYAPDFTFACEGLGNAGAQPSWQIRFEQRAGHEDRLYGWTVKGTSYDVRLKGRAWVAPGSFRVVRLEVDLMEPLESIKLLRNHIAIEYGPVQPPGQAMPMWLPSNADFYTLFKGKLFRQSHTFGGFTLFNVDSQQKIADPKEKK